MLLNFFQYFRKYELHVASTLRGSRRQDLYMSLSVCLHRFQSEYGSQHEVSQESIRFLRKISI